MIENGGIFLLLRDFMDAHAWKCNNYFVNRPGLAQDDTGVPVECPKKTIPCTSVDNDIVNGTTLNE
mgnify:CR=1 FL=1